MTVFENGYFFEIPDKWLAEHDKQVKIDSEQEVFERGYDACRRDAIEELKSLLRCRNYRGCAAGKGCDGICRIDSDICRNCENFGIPYSLLAEKLPWLYFQKGGKECAKEIYQEGRADQKKEDNDFFNFEGAWELEKRKACVFGIDIGGDIEQLKEVKNES